MGDADTDMRGKPEGSGFPRMDRWCRGLAPRARYLVGCKQRRWWKPASQDRSLPLITLPARLPLILDRKFFLSGHLGSHAQVLLRSGRSAYHNGQLLKYGSVVDVLFKDVSAMALVDSYYPLEISRGGDCEFASLHDLLGCSLGDRKIYVLQSGESRGYVVAGALYWIDDPDGSTSSESALVGDLERTKGLEVYTA